MSDTNTKYQKIASATYLITGFFSDLEPLKWKLRSTATDLVGESVKDKYSLIREMHALFGVAKSANLVSDTNHEILSHELSKLTQEVQLPLSLAPSVEEKREEKVGQPQLTQAPAQAEPESVKDKIIDKYLPEVKPEVMVSKFLPKETGLLKEFGVVSVKKNSRQSVIIGILKRKKEIMIKDVSPLISGCSEKTIQRELSAMVAAGVLRRIGDKRWSRYTLA